MEPSGRTLLARDRALLVDVLLALGIGLVQVLGVLLSERYGQLAAPWRDPDALAWLLLTGGPAALLLRRRWPLGVLAVTVACGLAYAARAYPEGPSQVAVYPALWTVALTIPRRLAWLAATGAAVAVATAELLLYDETMVDGEPLYVAVTVFAAMWWGEAVRVRRAYVAELRDRAERAERTREEEARRRVTEERLRIAWELHDVVSHTIGMINVQAGVAAHLLGRRHRAGGRRWPRSAGEQRGPRELRSILGVLRGATATPAGPAGPGARPGPPRRAGRPGERRRGGGRGRGRGRAPAAAPGRDRPGRLPDRAGGTDQRPAPRRARPFGRRARRVGPHESELEVEVTWTTAAGRAPWGYAAGGGGNGLTGMRTGWAAAGGRLEAGPGPDGGASRIRGGGPGPGPGGGGGGGGVTPVIRVVLADDQALVRAGFRALLDDGPDIEVVGEASDGATRCGWPADPARRRADGHPDAGDGRPRRDPGDRRGPALPASGCVVLTTFELDEYVFEALRAGASGFLVKDTEPDELLRGGPGGRRRRRAAVAERHPAADRRVRRRARPARPRPRRRPGSPGRC